MYQENHFLPCAEIQSLPKAPETPGSRRGGNSFKLSEKLKYTVCGFDQKKLIEYGLDSIDVFILCFIRDLPTWAEMHICDDGNRYFWCLYKELLKDYPIVRITKETLKKRIKKYCKIGLIKLFIWRMKMGTKSMIYNTDLLLQLTYEGKKHE